MKPKYFHVLLGFKMDPPIDERLRGGGLKKSCNLLK